MPRFFKDKTRLLFFFALIVICGMVLFSTHKPRGTDQFWHLSDAISVSQGVYTSNNHFPNSNLHAQDQQRARPFVQNRPFVYLAGALVKFTGDAVLAYKIINILSCLGLFVLVLRILEKSRVPQTLWPVFVAAPLAIPGFVYPLFQPLPVAFDAFLFLAMFHLFLKIKDALQQGRNGSAAVLTLLSGALAVVFAFQRIDHLLFVVLLPFVMLVKNPLSWPEQTEHCRPLLVAGAFVLLVLLGYGLFRPANHLEGFPITLNAILSVGTPADWHNMTFFFADPAYLASLDTVDLLKQKAQLFSAAVFAFDPLLLPFNLLFLLALWVFTVRMFKSPFPLFYLFSVGMLLAFYAVMFAFQFQYRYGVFLLLPVTLMLVQSVPTKPLENAPALVHKLAFAVCVLTGLLMALGSLKRNAADAAHFETFLNQLPASSEVKGNALVHWYPNPGLSIAYRYRDAKVFYITPSTLKRSDWSHIDVIFDHGGDLQRADPVLFKEFRPEREVQGWTVWVKQQDRPAS